MHVLAQDGEICMRDARDTVHFGLVVSSAVVAELVCGCIAFDLFYAGICMLGRAERVYSCSTPASVLLLWVVCAAA